MRSHSTRARALAAALGWATLGGVLCSVAACRRPGSHRAAAPYVAADGGAPRCPGPRARCKYFKAICYEGYRDFQAPGAAEPTCDQVAADLKKIAPFTRGIRTYGSSSTQHDGKCIPALTDRLGLDLHMGIWVDNHASDAQNLAAIDDSMAAAQGHPSIKTIIVGNEFMTRVRQSFGDHDAAEKRLVSYIRYARAKAPPRVAVVTAESDAEWLVASPALFRVVDFILWHAHPWWTGVAIAQAAAEVKASHEKMLAAMKMYAAGKREVLGETGWPWAIQDGAAVGSEANQAQYLLDIDRYSASVGLEYWMFEAFDESWKNEEGPVGGRWGLWPADRSKPGREVIVRLPIRPTSASLIPPADMWP
jgi:exo-beta-1,3-glucanase (GH17 family)